LTPGTIEDYCRRDEEGQLMISSEEENQSCFDGILVSFDKLKAQHVSTSDLLDWYAPFDIIDEYQLFLDDNITLNNPHFWCNCSNQAFGARCEYTFEQYKLTEKEINDPLEKNGFAFVEDYQFKNKVRTSQNQSSVTDGTCYMGLPECNKNRIICLHWNEICDGKLFILNRIF